jgi:hypothetical protein
MFMAKFSFGHNKSIVSEIHKDLDSGLFFYSFQPLYYPLLTDKQYAYLVVLVIYCSIVSESNSSI